MKKLMAILLTLSLAAVPCTVSAKSGDVVGKIYSTDILADINGKPVHSYNIGGKTVVIAEEMEESGFDVSYNDSTRHLTLALRYGDKWQGGDNGISRGKVGKVVGSVYETDITVTVNNLPITGYNIGGKTALCLEDLGKVVEGEANYDYGYSKYLCHAVWNEKARTISLNTFISSFNTLPTSVHSLTFTLKDNMLTPSYDAINYYRGLLNTVDPSDEFKKEPFVIKPLYLMIGNQKTQVGTAYLYSMEGQFIYVFKYEDESFCKALEGFKPKTMTYTEAVDYIQKTEKSYTVSELADNESYTVWMLSKPSDTELNDYRIMVANKKKGGLICVSNIYIKSVKLIGSQLTLTTTIATTSGPAQMVEEYNLDDYDFEN